MIWPEAHRVMITGHRKLSQPLLVRDLLFQSLHSLRSRRGPLVGLSGMALGADQLFAEACQSLGIPFVAAIPIASQADRWPQDLRDRYNVSLRACFGRVNVWQTEGYLLNRDAPIAAYFHVRNKWLVDHCTSQGTVIAVWDGQPKGGTYGAYRLALAAGHRILVVDPNTGELRVDHPAPVEDPKKVRNAVMELFGAEENPNSD